MPVTFIKRRDKYRVVESADGSIATRDDGEPVDGGGFKTRAQAAAQVRAINAKEQEELRKNRRG